MGTLKIRQRVLMPNIEGSTANDGTARTAAAAAQASADAAQADVDGLELYSTTAGANGEKWVGGSIAVQRKVIAIAAGPNASTVNVAHGITSPVRFTDVRIVLQTASAFLCFGQGGMLSDTIAHSILVSIDGTNVSLTSGAGGDYHLYSGHVILEYTLS